MQDRLTLTIIHSRQKRDTGRAHKVMISLLLMGCGLVVLQTCTYIIECLVLDKYGLVTSLPGGLVAQEISANSQSATTVSFVLKDIVANMMVKSVQTLSL